MFNGVLKIGRVALMICVINFLWSQRWFVCLLFHCWATKVGIHVSWLQYIQISSSCNISIRPIIHHLSIVAAISIVRRIHHGNIKLKLFSARSLPGICIPSNASLSLMHGRASLGSIVPISRTTLLVVVSLLSLVHKFILFYQLICA